MCYNIVDLTIKNINYIIKVERNLNMEKSSIEDLGSTKIINEILNSIEKEREREIISRRFGLFYRKETLEQIGEMLSITRERVRQLEKSIFVKLKSNQALLQSENFIKYENFLINQIKNKGGVITIDNLALITSKDPKDKAERSRLSFIGLLSNKFHLLEETDSYYPSLFLLESFKNQKDLINQVDKIYNIIKEANKPLKLDELSKLTKIEDQIMLDNIASVSKLLANLNHNWGLIKWPTVNPKNIRDKIYVILKENGKQMHFNEIAEAIKSSDFKRKDVTTQAIHNELIKDKRFVLVGRGIYTLKEWGYQEGTVAEIITKILKESGKPLHRDEIVKRVLKDRFVKETTILLNLQAKKEFKRYSKATYGLAEEKSREVLNNKSKS